MARKTPVHSSTSTPIRNPTNTKRSKAQSPHTIPPSPMIQPANPHRDRSGLSGTRKAISVPPRRISKLSRYYPLFAVPLAAVVSTVSIVSMFIIFVVPAALLSVLLTNPAIDFTNPAIDRLFSFALLGFCACGLLLHIACQAWLGYAFIRQGRHHHRFEAAIIAAGALLAGMSLHVAVLHAALYPYAISVSPTADPAIGALLGAGVSLTVAYLARYFPSRASLPLGILDRPKSLILSVILSSAVFVHSYMIPGDDDLLGTPSALLLAVIILTAGISGFIFFHKNHECDNETAS